MMDFTFYCLVMYSFWFEQGASGIFITITLFGGDLYISISGNGYEKSLCGFYTDVGRLFSY